MAFTPGAAVAAQFYDFFLDARTPGRLRKLLQRLEPWYDWGREDEFRLDSLSDNFDDDVVGEVRFFRVQWLGFHFGLQFGRTPAKQGGAA